MKKVYVARDPADAHLLRGVLEGENIEAEVHGEFLFGIRGEVPLTEDTCPSVWVVDDADYDRATEVVKTFHRVEPRGPFERRNWRCGCGEENEGQFMDCWSCGRARPVS